MTVGDIIWKMWKKYCCSSANVGDGVEGIEAGVIRSIKSWWWRVVIEEDTDGVETEGWGFVWIWRLYHGNVQEKKQFAFERSQITMHRRLDAMMMKQKTESSTFSERFSSQVWFTREWSIVLLTPPFTSNLCGNIFLVLSTEKMSYWGNFRWAGWSHEAYWNFCGNSTIYQLIPVPPSCDFSRRASLRIISILTPILGFLHPAFSLFVISALSRSLLPRFYIFPSITLIPPWIRTCFVCCCSDHGILSFTVHIATQDYWCH